MEKSKFKLMLSGFLMIFLVSFANNSFAQGSANLAEKTAASSSAISSEMGAFFADKETAKSNLLQAISIYKTVANSAAAGSANQVDAIRRIDVYAEAWTELGQGETVNDAYEAAGKFLFNKIEYTKAELPALNQIKQDLFNLLKN